tara:strand:- start:203 stop:1180 length:978 start_codon:yes stop_codon:yes gene_type:complete
MLEYYKTYYVGTEDTGEIVDNNDIILLDDHNIHSYADLIASLSEEYWKTGLQHQQKLRAAVRRTKLLITKLQSQGLKCNIANKNTSLETIEWFLSNMVPPPGGMIISIYFYENLYPGLINPWKSQTIWPLKQQWLGDGNYITVQDITPAAAGYKNVTAADLGHKELIENIEKYCPYPVKYVSYKDGEELTLEKLVHTKRHFAYTGGSYFMAAMVNTPTVCYGHPLRQHTRFIYDIKTINWPDKKDRRQINYEGSMWNGGDTYGLDSSRTCHYDIDRQICFQKPQTYVKHCTSKEELLGYITFSQELEILQRDRTDWSNISDLTLI